MTELLNKLYKIYYKIVTIINTSNSKLHYNIKSNSQILLYFNNLKKMQYNSNKRLLLYKDKSKRSLSSKYITYDFRKYIYNPTQFIDTPFAMNKLYFYNFILKYIEYNNNTIFYLIPIDTKNSNSVSIVEFLEMTTRIKNNTLSYKYIVQQPLKNEKDIFDIKYNLNDQMSIIEIKTNKYSKEYLLELKKMNLQKVNIFIIFAHITYPDMKYLSEAKSVMDTFYHFLLSCIVCEKDANSNFIIRIGISKVSYQLIYIISQYYEKIILENDKTFVDNAQLYLFCTNFKGICDSEFNQLLDIYDQMCKKQPYLGFYINSHNDDDRKKFNIIREKKDSDNTEFIESIFDNELPTQFIEKISNHIDQILDKQTKYYEYLEWFEQNKDKIDMEELDKLQQQIAISIFIEYNIPIKPMYSPLIYKLLTTRQLEDKKGQLIKLHSNIKRDEGDYLYNIVRKQKAKICIEVGMAYGTSALFICRALKYNNEEYTGHDKHVLYSIDPYQSTQWMGLGVENIKRDGLSDYHKLLEMTSYKALPMLLEEHEKAVDVIFIDGWHTFDYTLVDFFYSDLLLAIGGYIVLDDALHAGPAKVVRYIVENYTHYKRIDVNVRTIAVFRKTKHDDREWSYHRNF